MTSDARVDQLVARYDADGGYYVLTGWSSGPAGIATLPLADGQVLLDVDYAFPGTISQIEITAEDRILTDAAIRSVASLTLVSDLRSRLEVVDDRPRVVWSRQRGIRLSQHDLEGVGEVGHLAVLLAEHDNVRRGDLSRGLAALEAANLIATSDPDLQIAVDPVRLWHLAAAALSAISAPDVELAAALRWWELQIQLGDAVRHARAVDDAVSRELARQESRIASLPDAPAPVATPAFSQEDMPDGPHDAHNDVALAREPESTGDVTGVVVDPDVDLITTRATLSDGVLQIAAAGTKPANTDVFLRVFRAGTEHVPLAVVPFVTNVDGGNATAVVPRDLAAADMLIELTTTPYDPPLPPFVRNVTRAVRHGQDACRFGRRGDTDEAAGAWQRCANEWRATGDAKRATLADEYANGEMRRLQSSDPIDRTGARIETPFLSDLIE